MSIVWIIGFMFMYAVWLEADSVKKLDSITLYILGAIILFFLWPFAAGSEWCGFRKQLRDKNK